MEAYRSTQQRRRLCWDRTVKMHSLQTSALWQKNEANENPNALPSWKGFGLFLYAKGCPFKSGARAESLRQHARSIQTSSNSRDFQWYIVGAIWYTIRYFTYRRHISPVPTGTDIIEKVPFICWQNGLFSCQRATESSVSRGKNDQK